MRALSMSIMLAMCGVMAVSFVACTSTLVVKAQPTETTHVLTKEDCTTIATHIANMAANAQDGTLKLDQEQAMVDVVAQGCWKNIGQENCTLQTPADIARFKGMLSFAYDNPKVSPKNIGHMAGQTCLESIGEKPAAPAEEPDPEYQGPHVPDNLKIPG